MVRLLPEPQRRASGKPPSFNPTMVRLLQEVGSMTLQEITYVSIPQWCDCCAIILNKPTLAVLFQSHNGAIAAR